MSEDLEMIEIPTEYSFETHVSGVSFPLLTIAIYQITTFANYFWSPRAQGNVSAVRQTNTSSTFCLFIVRQALPH